RRDQADGFVVPYHPARDARSLRGLADIHAAHCTFPSWKGQGSPFAQLEKGRHRRHDGRPRRDECPKLSREDEAISLGGTAGRDRAALPCFLPAERREPGLAARLRSASPSRAAWSRSWIA